MVQFSTNHNKIEPWNAHEYSCREKKIAHRLFFPREFKLHATSTDGNVKTLIILSPNKNTNHYKHT